MSSIRIVKVARMGAFSRILPQTGHDPPVLSRIDLGRSSCERSEAGVEEGWYVGEMGNLGDIGEVGEFSALVYMVSRFVKMLLNLFLRLDLRGETGILSDFIEQEARSYTLIKLTVSVRITTLGLGITYQVKERLGPSNTYPR